MLLILREEILCLLILLFLLFYYAVNKVKTKGQSFARLVGLAIASVLLDMTTVVTVNHMDTVPDVVNRWMHILFYLVGILVGYQFYLYTIDLCALYKQARIMKRIGSIPILLFAVLLLVLPMEYVAGRGTYYSYGPLAIVGYALFLSYCMVCLFLLIYNRKRLEVRVQWAIFPMIAFMCATIIAQALVPELLMTSASITFVCLGLFVALDNPDKDYKEQAMWDFLTGLKNQNCFKRDMAMYRERFNQKNNRRRIGFVVADLNWLKRANDTYGHVEGDRLLSAAADALRDSLRQAEHIYRTGGDEFVAVYLSPDDVTVAHEMEQVRTACRSVVDLVVPLEIAMGYAADVANAELQQILDEADRRMYENKKFIKEQHGLQVTER